MADSPTAKKLTRPAASFARRYGLAFASVAGALLLDLLFRHFNLPHPFAAFALSAIAITFWYGGTKPGIVAVLLSSLIRGFIVEGASSLSRALYNVVFLLFAVLMIWVRRSRDALAVAVADRTARLTAANEELRREKEQLDGLFELSHDAVILTDEDFHVLRVNKEFTRMFEYTAEEVAGKWLPELIMPEELRAEALKNRDWLSSGNKVELETIRQRKDGIRFDVSVVAKGISLGFEQVSIYLIYRDISERKKAERKLSRSEANILESQRLVHMCSWAYDPSSGMVTFSPEAKRIFDIKSDQDTWPGDSFLDRFHPEDRPVQEEIFRRAQLDKTGYEASFRFVLPDGSIKHIYSVAHPVLNQSGELVEFFGIGMDVTAQHEARAALQSAFEQIKAEQIELRRMTDAVASYIYVLRPDGTALYANQTVLDYTGLTLEDVQREDQRARIFHPEDVERLREERHEALARGKPFELEQRALGKDGKYRWFLVRYNPLRDDQGHIIRWYATGTDIEDRKQAEERMRDENLALREQIDQAFMFEDIVARHRPCKPCSRAL